MHAGARMRKLVVIATLLTSSVAAAQPDPVEAPTPRVHKKRPSTAAVLAAGTFVSGVVVGGYGASRNETSLLVMSAGLLAFGPSAGHVYVGANRHAIQGTLLRSAGLGLIILGTGAGVPHDHNAFLAAAGIAGAGLLTGAIAYDLVDAPLAARRRNARALAVTPAIVRDAPGLALAGTF